MKIKKLIIRSARQLEDLDFDFTYPEGHEKAGTPLEKICLIGQSATGKTSILDLLKQNITNLSNSQVVNGKHLWTHSSLNFDGSIEYQYQNQPLISEVNKVIKNGVHFEVKSGGGGSISALLHEGIKLLYFTADTISKRAINFFNQNPVSILNSPTAKDVPNIKSQFENQFNLFELSQSIDDKILYALLSNILDYRKRFTQMASELINKGAIGDLNRLNKRYAEWARVNANPLIPFAESFNPILNKLNLEVDLVNTEYPIPIKSLLNDDVIPISNLSTGTQGLLLSLFPLFHLNTKDALILVDEPERSLFPDIQVDLISFYQRLAPEAQFIIATHSPFIAAAFEPEERFILYFDRNGKVRVRKGESPIGDDPNDMLQNDFKVDFYNQFGKDAYKQYTDLKQRLLKEIEPDKKKEILVELTKLGDKYNF